MESLKRTWPLALVALSIVAEFLYRDALTEKTFIDVPPMQSNPRPKTLLVFVSQNTSDYLFPLFLTFSFGFLGKMQAFHCWLSGAIILYIMSLLKMLYSEPRPFWVNPDIVPFSCKVTFGTPSGHCFLALVCLGLPYMAYYYEVGRKHQIKSLLCTAHIVKLFLTCGILIFFVLIAYSRLYLGAHTYAQVLFGFTLGSSLVLV